MILKFERERVQYNFNCNWDNDPTAYAAASRDYAATIKCRMTTCRVNRNGKCGMPSACEIDASGNCETGKAFREVIKEPKRSLRNPREGD